MSKQEAFLREHRVAEDPSNGRQVILAHINDLHRQKLLELKQKLIDHLEARKSIYFELNVPLVSGAHLRFEELTQISAYLAEKFPLWEFRQAKCAVLHTCRFRLRIARLYYPMVDIVVKAIPK